MKKLLLILLLISFQNLAYAQERKADSSTSSDNDLQKTAEELIDEAKTLLLSRHPIDARNKLQTALQKSPDDYRPYLFLAQYYLVDVAHFKLAYRYVLTAEELFKKKYGEEINIRDPELARQHGLLLFLRSEAELNLDKYQDSLNTLERFEKLYYATWLPRSKAWVLMKLKRLDDAISVAKSGLLFNPEERGIYNVLGILLSMRGDRELALKAFAKSIVTELSEGSSGQASTPLNNAGEVYRELFKDSLAEVSWIKAISLPDGCEHILPSLNLTILYIDQTRFIQAQRVLDDFQICFAQQLEKSDAEHKTLLALAKGKIDLHRGDVDQALKLLLEAKERQQWFGKIGTNQNDVEFASTISLARALRAKAFALNDHINKDWKEYFQNLYNQQYYLLNSWWLNRQARAQGVNELEDLEDLSIRNTDTMVEYPTIGSMLQGFPTTSLSKRLSRLEAEDKREDAKIYYQLYLAENLMDKGKYQQALSILLEIKDQFRAIDRLAKAEVLTDIIISETNKKYFWQSFTSTELNQNIKNREDLFGILPSQLRYYDLKLPVNFQITGITNFAKNIKHYLQGRFEEIKDQEVKYQLEIAVQNSSNNNYSLEISLIDKTDNSQISTIKKDISSKKEEIADLINNYVASTFKHRVDPPSDPLPKLELLKNVL